MENKAATESSDPIKQILQLIEKKIRNLEKRKSRLDTIREKARDRDSKVELNEEQKEAVEKYDGVVQNIEFAKELQKSVATIVTDHEKQQKKQQKKEKAERAAVEQKRFRELIDVQTLLDGLGEDKTRNDFLHGTHGATVISEADLTHLDNLYQLIRPSREAATNYEQKVSEAAEHVVSLLDGRDRPVGGTTYQHLHQLVDQVRSSNYFTAKHNGTSHEPVASAVPANSQVTPDLAVSGHHGNEAPQVTHASGDSELYAQPPAPVPHQAPPVSQPVFQAPVRPLHDLVPASPFNFLQDSEIEPNDYVGSVYEKSVYPAGSYADTGVPGSTFVPHNIATSLAALNVTAQGKDTFVGEGQSDNFNMQSQTFVNSNTAAGHQQDNAPGQPPFTGQFADNANGQVKAQDQHHHHGSHGYHQGRGGRGGYRGGRGGYQQRDSEGEWQHSRQYNGGQYNNHQHNNYRGGYRGGNRGDGRRRDDRGARQPQSAMS